MRLINADVLIAWTDNYYDSEKFTVGHFANMVKDMPTIEERKTGKWEKDTKTGRWRCSECYAFALKTDDGRESLSDYCPVCGAKMEEPEDIPMEYFENGGR